MGGVDETRCERAYKGSIDANAGPQVPCNPASSLERAIGVEPATSNLRWSHELSLPIRIRHFRPRARSRLLTIRHSVSRNLGSALGSRHHVTGSARLG